MQSFLECSPNEVFIECEGSCQPFCGSSFADSISNLNCGCVHGCVCKPNLIRSTVTGKCGPIKRCKKLLTELNATSLLCGENEHFTERNAGCQLSCYTLHNNKKNCQEARGCICNENFVRDTKSGNCIEIVKCPSESFHKYSQLFILEVVKFKLKTCKIIPQKLRLNCF